MTKTTTTSTAKKKDRLALRRQPTQARGLQTIEEVLKAAGSEIERGGLDKLTTKRIAAAAGLSVGALYEYFPNKEAIISAMAEQWMRRVLEAVDSVHPRHQVGRDLLSYLTEQATLVSALYRDQPGLSGLIDMLSAIPAVKEMGVRHDQTVVASVVSALEHYAPKADPEVLQSTAVSICIICHSMLTAALVYRSADEDQLFTNLKVCLMAMASRLMLSK